jgi:hypothetical protein
MHRLLIGRLLFAAASLTLATTRSAAQLASPTGGAGVLFESYSFGSPDKVDLKKVSLLTIPVAARVFLAPKIEFGVSSAYASGTLTRSGGQATTISGPTDTELRLTYGLVEDRVRISAAALAPTGKSQLTAQEMDVTGVIAADLLPFAISNWGSGGGLGVSAAFAAPMNDVTTLGLSAGYVVARKYEPLSATTFAYRPGNQLQIRAAADRTVGSAAKASVQLTYLHFGQDQGDGSNLYQSGDRLQAVGSLAFAAGTNSTGIVYAGYLRRQQGEYTTAVRVTPAQDLLYAGTAFRRPVGGAILVPSLDARILGNASGVEQGRTISAGLALEFPSGNFEVVPRAQARFGSLTVRTGQESTFTGMELGLSIRSRSGSR